MHVAREGDVLGQGQLFFHAHACRGATASQHAAGAATGLRRALARIVVVFPSTRALRLRRVHLCL